jgi:hypothetical protein
MSHVRRLFYEGGRNRKPASSVFGLGARSKEHVTANTKAIANSEFTMRFGRNISMETDG